VAKYLANYTQIMAYQIEEQLNHSGKHGGMAKIRPRNSCSRCGARVAKR